MKRFVIIGLIFIPFLFLGAIYFNVLPSLPVGRKHYSNLKEPPENSQKEETIFKKKQRVIIETKSIFVPDWALTEETILVNGYNRWIYFGGEEKLPVFTEALKDKELWITYKVDTVDELKSVEIGWNQLKSVNHMKGIVLDLEINGLATEEFISEINRGVEKIYNQIKQNNLKMAVAVYGDLFYRKRPYDLQFLNENSDEIMVMAYDFSKSYGEPGPNFPFENDGGYDFQEMIDDFLEYAPAEKLTIIFGMYGYDWILVDGKPLKQANALSLNQVEELVVTYPERPSQIDKGIEKSFNYKDERGLNHVVYYEDEESAAVKIDYLKEKGIGNITYWAYGYF